MDDPSTPPPSPGAPAVVPASGEAIAVYARVRPSRHEGGGDANVCTALEVRGDTIDAWGGYRDPRSFTFNGVFDGTASQEAVFLSVGAPIVASCLDGYNGAIFAYGQTGSGKTFTMMGPESSSGEFETVRDETSHIGVIPRTLRLLFEELEGRRRMMGTSFAYTCRLSFVELYNEKMYDLLVVGKERGDKLRLSVSPNFVAVRGMVEEAVEDYASAMAAVERGWHAREVAATAMNSASSRSHAILQIKLHTRTTEDRVVVDRKSCLNLVDLAGSERVAHSRVEGEQFKEACHLNNSLTVLGRSFRILSTPGRTRERVPFRDSKLTTLLRDSLGGNARTAVIVNVHPDEKYASETRSTLEFGESVRAVRNSVKQNLARCGKDDEKLRARICQLERERAELIDQNRILGEKMDIFAAQIAAMTTATEALARERRLAAEEGTKGDGPVEEAKSVEVVEVTVTVTLSTQEIISEVPLLKGFLLKFLASILLLGQTSGRIAGF